MIILSIGEKRLTLRRDTKIRIDFQWPTLDDVKMPGSFAYQFDVPSTPDNNATLEHADYFERDFVRFYDATLTAETLILNGKLIVQELGHTAHTCAFVVDGTGVEMGDTELRSLALPSFTIGNTTAEIIAAAASNNTQTYPAVPFVFPQIYAPDFYGGANDTFLGYLNDLFPNYITGGGDVMNESAIAAQPFLFAVLDYVFSTFGYTWGGNVKEIEEITRLLLWSNYSQDNNIAGSEVEARETVPQDFNLTEEEIVISTVVSDPDNLYTTGKYEIPSAGVYVIEIETNLQSGYYNRMRITAYIDGVAKAGNDSFYIGYNKQTFSVNADGGDVGKYIYLTAQVADESMDMLDISIKIYNESLLNTYSGLVDFSKMVPDGTVSELINAFCRMFAIAPFFDRQKQYAEFVTYKSIYESGEYVDISQSVDRRKISFPQEERSYFTRLNFDGDGYAELNFRTVNSGTSLPKYLDIYAVATNTAVFLLPLNQYWRKEVIDNVSQWNGFMDYHDTIGQESDTATDISPDAATLLMHHQLQEPHNLTLTGRPMPKIKQSGVSEMFATGENSPGMRMMFYWGIQPSEVFGASDYALASSTRYNAEGTELGRYTLRMTGADGLYDNFIRYYELLVGGAKHYKAKLYLNGAQVADIARIFQPQGNSRQVRKIRIDNRNMIPLRFSVVIDMAGIRECEIECV